MEINSMLTKINTNYNEYAPDISYYPITNNNESNFESFLFYTQDSLNEFILNFMINQIDSVRYTSSTSPNIYMNSYGLYSVNILNSYEYNVSNVSLRNGNIYFSPDIDGAYDIYELEIDTTMNIIDFLTQKINLFSQAKKIVSSTKDDKCPFIIENTIFFTSDRNGGQGGFDIWYSKLNNGVWSSRINLGKDFNTEKDEYSPIVVKYYDMPNNLMIFSSNRVGSQGGFDLYYMGTELLRF